MTTGTVIAGTTPANGNGTVGTPAQQQLWKTRVGLRNEQIINNMLDADPRDIQKIAASQIRLLNSFYSSALEQANSSFHWAVGAAVAGLVFFLAAVGFYIVTNNSNLAQISLISGALIQVISGINFYLYGRTTQQLAYFNTQLDQTQRYLLANSLCESLQGDARDASRAVLINLIAGNQQSPKQAPGAG